MQLYFHHLHHLIISNNLNCNILFRTCLITPSHDITKDTLTSVTIDIISLVQQLTNTDTCKNQTGGYQFIRFTKCKGP